MLRKLTIALIAAALAVPCMAGQLNGRDSTYAGAEPAGRAPASAVVHGNGRDSIYASDVKTTKSLNVAVSFRPGRA